VPPTGQDPNCNWKGIPTNCGPRGLPPESNLLFHNNGDGTFTDVSERAGIAKPGRGYRPDRRGRDFDNDGWPDLYVAADSTPALLYHNRTMAPSLRRLSNAASP